MLPVCWCLRGNEDPFHGVIGASRPQYFEKERTRGRIGNRRLNLELMFPIELDDQLPGAGARLGMLECALHVRNHLRVQQLHSAKGANLAVGQGFGVNVGADPFVTGTKVAFQTKRECDWRPQTQSNVSCEKRSIRRTILNMDLSCRLPD